MRRCGVVIIVWNIWRIIEEGARDHAWGPEAGRDCVETVRHGPGTAECGAVHGPRVPIRAGRRIGPSIRGRNKKASHHAAHHYHG